MYTVRLAIVVAASLAAACSNSSSSLTSPSSVAASGQALTADRLAGAWKLASMQPSSQGEQAAPAGVSYSLTFSGDRVVTRVDCNTCSGTYTLSGDRITVGPALACTRAACPTMAFEATYTSLLSGESTVTLAGNLLVLSSPRGALHFTR